ncbi:MAG: hypothetical protein JSS65_04785 [Armatimonadetes bacterium]|nr:hypothetical protein [Armatimonadota bacterium]
MLVGQILGTLLVVGLTVMAGVYLLVVLPRRDREDRARKIAELQRIEDEKFRAVAEQELEECGIHLESSNNDQA